MESENNGTYLTFPMYENENIFLTIESIISELMNNPNILTINSTDGTTIHFDVEVEVKEDDKNYFKNCKEINDTLGKPYKLKKDNMILDECLICMDNYKVGEFVRNLSNCNHCYHKKCIDKWLKKNGSCPICRNWLI